MNATWITNDGLSVAIPVAVIAALCPLGDFNVDRVVNLLDIDLLAKTIVDQTLFVNAETDLNADEFINQDDLDLFLSGNFITDGNKLNGDSDFDGMVTFADFSILSSNFGQDGKKWSEGDFIANGRVEFDDFLTLSANFGETAGSVNQVPEPSTSLLTAFGILGLLGLRRRR